MIYLWWETERENWRLNHVYSGHDWNYLTTHVVCHLECESWMCLFWTTSWGCFSHDQGIVQASKKVHYKLVFVWSEWDLSPSPDPLTTLDYIQQILHLLQTHHSYIQMGTYCGFPSSTALFAAMSMASISAALKPDCSSFCIPAIVVPAGDATSSFNWRESRLLVCAEWFHKTISELVYLSACLRAPTTIWFIWNGSRTELHSHAKEGSDPGTDPSSEPFWEHIFNCS